MRYFYSSITGYLEFVIQLGRYPYKNSRDIFSIIFLSTLFLYVRIYNWLSFNTNLSFVVTFLTDGSLAQALNV